MLCFLVSIALFFIQSTNAGSNVFQGTVQLLGRFDITSKTYPRAGWGGTGIRFFVDHGHDNKAKANLYITECVDTSSCNYYLDIIVDCELYSTIHVDSEQSNPIEIDFLNSYSRSEVSVIRRDESYGTDAYTNDTILGIFAFSSVNVNGGSLIKLVDSDDDDDNSNKSIISTCWDKDVVLKNGNIPKNILIVGDSISNAYGVEHDENDCHFSASTENISKSYASLVGAGAGADVHVIAWSGKGVVRNYGDENSVSINPMPNYYNKTIATEDGSFWNPDVDGLTFLPDLVIIALGTNDYSTLPNPSDTDFQEGYNALINRIHSDYPKASFLTVCEPLFSGNQCKNIQQVSYNYKKKNVNFPIRYLAVPETIFEGGYGCDGHPNQASQQNIANYLLPTVLEMF